MTDHKHTECCQSSCTPSNVPKILRPSEEADDGIKINLLDNSVISSFFVSGMDCSDEIAAIQKSLVHPLVESVQANLITSQVKVTHSPTLSRKQIIQLINQSGVHVRESQPQISFYANNLKRIWLITTSGILLFTGLILQYFTQNFTSTSHFTLFFIFLFSTIFGGALIFPKAIRSLRQKSLDMNFLMILAAFGAFFIQEFSEGASVVFLFSFAEMLEAFSVAKARKAIREVLSVTPQTANIELNGSIRTTQVEFVQVGESIVVLAGERIPLDGTITSGSSTVNQAPLTGESLPILKSVGDLVLAGTINESGTLKVLVSHTFKDSKISNVIRMVEEAQSKKAPAQLFVDQFARIYTPTVTALAILVALVPPLFYSGEWSLWFYRALVFLVIACPCALVIATPISIVSALTALARIGVLVKGGTFLESLGKLQALALDKTGTVTEGRPRVVSLTEIKPGAETELLAVVHSLEKQSSHPLARASVDYCVQKNISSQAVYDFKVIHGKGVEGRIDEHQYFAGNHQLAHELEVCSPFVESHLNNLEDQAQSVLVVGHKPHNNCPGEVLGILGLADEPRFQASKAIQELHSIGIRHILILSGDNQRTVQSIAKRVGIDSAQGDLLPNDKVHEIQNLLKQYTYVGMIGDGINDAPALAQATIGIAMGAGGTDAAIETADVALMTDDLNQVAKAVAHGRKTLAIIRFNIGFALATKAVFIVLGLLGYSSLWLAVAADMGATLLVIANALRLLKIANS